MSELIPRLCLAFALSGGIAFIALRLRALSLSGSFAACFVGGLVFGCGGWFWAGALLTFFVTSTILGRWSRFIRGNRRKRKQDAAAVKPEKSGRRDAVQVLANGSIPALCALVQTLDPWLSWLLDRTHPREMIFVAFVAALAAANGDTWATEIGTAYGRKPRMITTGRRVPIGASGAVTAAGSIAAALGTLTLALFVLGTGVQVFLIVWVSGLIGVLVDSILGATLQGQGIDPRTGRLTERWPHGTLPVRGLSWMRNDLVNALSVLAATIAAIILYMKF